MKRLIMLISIIAAVFAIHVTAFAMDPTTAEFTVKNQDVNAITVNVSTDDYSEDFTIEGSGTKKLSYDFSEPGTYEYKVKRTDKSTDQEYVVQICVQTDEQGQLKAYVVPRVTGELEKPLEVTFGTPPAPPQQETTPTPKIEKLAKTGDNTNINTYILIAISATTLIVLLVWIMVWRNAKNKEQDESES